MKTKLYLTVVLVWMSFVAMAQSLTVTGVVMAQDEPDPVIGANVMIKGTTAGTITDFDGNFSLQAKQLRDNLKASLFNVHRFDILNHLDASPSGKYCRN